MNLSKQNMTYVHECIDGMSDSQKIHTIMRLHENPPENIDAVQEAIACYEALDDMGVYTFLQKIKATMKPEDWETLTS